MSVQLTMHQYPDRKQVRVKRSNGLEQVNVTILPGTSLRKVADVLNEKTASWRVRPFTVDDLRFG